MADSGALREFAAANGHAGKRGRLPQSLINRWNTEHPEDPYVPEPPRDPADVSSQIDAELDGLFGDDADEGGLDDVYRDDDGLGETTPRRPPRGGRRQAGKPGTGLGLFGRGKQGGQGKGRGKKQPRVSTEDLLGSLWRGMAKLATPLPPLQRTLRVQAPVAGLLLDDAVKGTIADTVLQPLARAAGAGKTVSALVGPPLFVTVMTLHLQQAAANETQPNPVVLGVMSEGLRSSLMAWMDVAGPKFEIALAREREFEDKYGADVDQFIEWLFSAMPQTAEQQAAEEAMYARSTGRRDDA